MTVAYVAVLGLIKVAVAVDNWVDDLVRAFDDPRV